MPLVAVDKDLASRNFASVRLTNQVFQFEETGGKSLKDSMGIESAIYGLILNLEEDGVRAIIRGAALDRKAAS